MYWLGLFNHSDELLHFLWFAGHTCVDTRSAFFFGTMHPLGREIGASHENQVKLVPVFRSRVSLGRFVLGFCHEEGVGDREAVVTAEF